MENLIGKLNAYGADVKGAMERFLDDEELYELCLNTFLDDPAYEQLRDALETGDCGKAFDAAHSLKGVAGNLGLTPLYNAVCAVVEPLRAGCIDVSAQYQQLLAQKDALAQLMA